MYDDFSYGTSSSEGMMLGAFFWIAAFALYAYFSYMQYRIASEKTGPSEDAWWAFIPIMNTLLLIKMAEKPMWWFFLMFIPIVNIFVFFALWMQVAKNCGQSPIWGFLVLIPLIQFVAVFVLAFGSNMTYDDQPPEKKYPVSIS